MVQKVADARSKRELEQLRTVSAKSHKQRLEVRTCSALRLHSSLLLTHHPPGVQRQTIFAPRNQRNTQRCRRWMSIPVIDPPRSARCRRAFNACRATCVRLAPRARVYYIPGLRVATPARQHGPADQHHCSIGLSVWLARHRRGCC